MGHKRGMECVEPLLQAEMGHPDCQFNPGIQDHRGSQVIDLSQVDATAMATDGKQVRRADKDAP